MRCYDSFLSCLHVTIINSTIFTEDIIYARHLFWSQLSCHEQKWHQEYRFLKKKGKYRFSLVKQRTNPSELNVACLVVLSTVRNIRQRRNREERI